MIAAKYLWWRTSWVLFRDHYLHTQSVAHRAGWHVLARVCSALLAIAPAPGTIWFMRRIDTAEYLWWKIPFAELSFWNTKGFRIPLGGKPCNMQYITVFVIYCVIYPYSLCCFGDFLIPSKSIAVFCSIVQYLWHSQIINGHSRLWQRLIWGT